MRRAGNGSPLTIDLKEGQQKISWGGKTQGRGRLRRTGRPEEQVDGRLCLIGVRFVRTTRCLCPVVAGWTYEFIAIHGGSWTPVMNRIVARYCRPDLRLLLAIDPPPSSSVWSDGTSHSTVPCRAEVASSIIHPYHFCCPFAALDAPVVLACRRRPLRELPGS
jgi:hypothetical protein